MKLTSSDDRFSTLFCGVVSSDRRKLRYVNAGHVPPMIVRSDGGIEAPKGGDIPVGMLDGSRYRERVIDLRPENLILCISDGITEVYNRQYEFWDERTIEQVLHEHQSAPLDTLTHSLVAAADRWAGGAEQHDDMTVVAVRITD